ncbi:MAG TPA: BMP family ABC transporter substrate-binding protein [Anaerolineales bacterium]|nr:BMP family ABC transporter substrate-binding protein [Anaerolineales bacterium]
MRKNIVLLLLAIAFSGIAACTQQHACFRGDVFCVGLVTDTRGLDDHGINQETWAGLTQSEAQGIIHQTAYIESVDPRDYDKNISFFVNEGYDVIVTSGIGLHDATLRNADLHPATVFIGMNQTDEESIPNFISVTFPEDQMGFVAGLLAARLTRTNIIGGVCETSGIDSMWRYCEGFRAGAKHINDSLRVIVVYRDNGGSESLFNDADWGTETAQALIEQGADVIFAAGGETGAGALRAATEAGIPAIGAERDQNAALAEKGSGVVASILGRASFTVQDLMRRVREGNLADAATSPIGFIVVNSEIPGTVVAEMDAAVEGLANGEIETNVSNEKP